MQQQLAVAVLLAATAYVSYALTKRFEEEKRRKFVFEQYQEEKAQKAQVAQQREKAGEPPSGELLEGLSIDKVFVWKIEDLRKRYKSANVENVMKNKPGPASAIRSPMLRMGSSISDDGKEEAEAATRKATALFRRSMCVEDRHQQYCKLITDDQVILSDVVRKPSMPHQTVGYMRAGPRARLHFDPAKVNAAIVTCGGLCPGEFLE